MKKITSILMMLIISMSLSACSNIENNKNVNDSKIEVNSLTENIKNPKIKLASLTEEESKILQLLEDNTSSQIFDYIVDEKAKSVHIKQYILDENSEWKERSASSFQPSNLKGRIAISINDNGTLRLALQDKTGVSSWISDPDTLEDSKSYGSSISWADSSDIVYNQEIPLALQVLSTSNEVNTYEVESFLNPPKPQETDTVTAITITFSEDNL